MFSITTFLNTELLYHLNNTTNPAYTQTQHTHTVPQLADSSLALAAQSNSAIAMKSILAHIPITLCYHGEQSHGLWPSQTL